MKKHLLLLTLFILNIYFVFGQFEKKKSIQISISSYKSFLLDIPFISFSDSFYLINKRYININFQYNKKITNYYEIGIYCGIHKYPFPEYKGPYYIVGEKYGPIFGLNFNFNFLPLIGINTTKVNLYSTIKFGFAYLSKIEADGLFITRIFEEPDVSKFRYEYGMGIGGSVKILNGFSVYIESHMGNFSFFPKLTSSYSNSRIGIKYSW